MTSTLKQHNKVDMDWLLFGSITALIVIGIVMVFSASIELADRYVHQTYYHYLQHHIQNLFAGLFLAWVVTRFRLVRIEQYSKYLIFIALLLLFSVLYIGTEVNGSFRWIKVGPFRFQPSEIAKLFFIIFLAGYMVRHSQKIKKHPIKSWIFPLVYLGAASVLLYLEPDFGALVVIFATAIGMIYLGGIRHTHFFISLLAIAVIGIFLITSSQYRMQRFLSFIEHPNPCDKEIALNEGYQLCNSLIAFGQGEWTGVGLGNSIQKLSYLPETHTDFVLAILAEEMGLVGTLTVIILFSLLIWRAFVIGANTERVGNKFGAYLAYGIGIWISIQAIINMGVNVGVLPTKGLTLPLVSYGGSNMVVTIVAMGLLLRIDYERRSNNKKRKSKT